MALKAPNAVSRLMTPPPKPTLEEIAAYARRHGLDKLSPAHIARMAELAVYVGELGRTLPRPAAKDDKPATAYLVSRSNDR